MSNVQIEEKIIKVILSVNPTIKRSEINSNANIFIDLCFDSFNLILLLINIEKEFQIHLEEDDYDYNVLSTVRSLTNMVEQKIVVKNKI